MSEIKKCFITGKPFEISDQEIAFCERLGMPLPEISPKERLRKLMATRNEWKLYKRKCDATGEDIISAYPEDSQFTVYNNPYWWGDEWNALDYGRDFDFNRPFFEQFAELQKVVPREGTTVFNSENCDYNGHIRESKNCYINSLIYRCEDVYYSYWIDSGENIVDCLFTNFSTLCYYCSDVNNCYQCVALAESVDSHDCYYSYQLRGCENCIFCSNLANKNYYINNKPCSKEEFETLKKKLLDGSYETWQKNYQEYLNLRKNAKQRFVHNLKCENCTGDHLINCKNCQLCFDGYEGEDCYNLISISGSKDIYNAYSSGWTGCEVLYNCAVSRASQDLAFCTYCWYSSGLRYCDSCATCKNCFGCIGLRHKEHCIFNKQYSKEEYEELVVKIIEYMKQTGEFGQFFPPNLSPYAYNESAAQDFWPLEKEKAIELGFKWRDKDEKEYQPATIGEIPDNIKDVDDSITKEVLACEDCGKNYKIIKQELKYYREQNLPIPRECPMCRHTKRFNLRNPYILSKRECDKCGVEIKTTYSPERKEVVYCERCYLESIA